MAQRAERLSPARRLLPTALGRSEEAFRPLPPARKLALVGEILTTYFIVRWRLARSDLRRTVAALRPETVVAHPEDGPGALVNGWRLGSAVIRTLRLLPADSRCLVRSLVLTRLLARRGIAASLVIGVRSGPEFGAHAWVEHDGRALLPQKQDEFERLVEI